MVLLAKTSDICKTSKENQNIIIKLTLKTKLVLFFYTNGKFGLITMKKVILTESKKE